MTALKMTIVDSFGTKDVVIPINHAVIAGWAGRDRNAVEHHIRELEALGVPRPATTPTYYRIAASRFSNNGSVEDAGPNATGEVEAVLVAYEGQLYVGVGSDHTDRKAETFGVTLSKQMCDKPVAKELWPYDEVGDHWDELILRSFAVIDGQPVLYQEGTLAELLPPMQLIKGYIPNDSSPQDGFIMFCGTVPAIGGIKQASRFVGELEDPVLKRRIVFGYDIFPLPIMG